MLARAVEPEMARDPERTGIAVVLRVEQAVTLAGEVFQERVPDFRWSARMVSNPGCQVVIRLTY